MQKMYKKLPRSIKADWKFLRWDVFEGIKRLRERRNRPYSWKDFEFDRNLDDALCAIMQRN